MSEERRFRTLSRTGYGFKKIHYKDGLILSQSKIVSTEIRGIGLVFLPVFPIFTIRANRRKCLNFGFHPP
jgi:hypothetical protein